MKHLEMKLQEKGAGHMNEEMKKKMRKVGIEINFCMGITLSFFLSLVGTLSSGHFTVPGWLLSFLVSTIIISLGTLFFRSDNFIFI